MAFRPYPMAKFLLSNALFTEFYIVGLGKVFGSESLAVKPLKALKNGLYKEGIKFIPKDDAEREMWWIPFNYKEYEVFYRDKYLNYGNKNGNLSNQEIANFMDYTDNLYLTAINLATKQKLKDKEFQSLRYKIFINNLVFDYMNYRYRFLEEYNKNLINSDEIKKIQKLLNSGIGIIDYCKKNENESYKTVERDPKMNDSEPIFKYLTSGIILDYSFKHKQKVQCNSNNVQMFIDSRYELESMLSTNQYSEYLDNLLNDRVFATIKFIPILDEIEQKCSFE